MVAGRFKLGMEALDQEEEKQIGKMNKTASCGSYNDIEQGASDQSSQQIATRVNSGTNKNNVVVVQTNW